VQLVLLLLFGALGTVSRYGLQGLVQFRTVGSFPTGTLLVNLLDCSSTLSWSIPRSYGRWAE